MKTPVSMSYFGFTKAEIEQARSASGKVIVILATDKHRRSMIEYTVYRELFASEKFCSVEDSTLWKLDDAVAQYEVDTKRGDTFKDKIDTCIAQSPQVLLVGEIRDIETAKVIDRARSQDITVITGMRALTAESARDALTSFGLNMSNVLLLQDVMDMIPE